MTLPPKSEKKGPKNDDFSPLVITHLLPGNKDNGEDPFCAPTPDLALSIAHGTVADVSQWNHQKRNWTETGRLYWCNPMGLLHYIMVLWDGKMRCGSSCMVMATAMKLALKPACSQIVVI